MMKRISLLFICLLMMIQLSDHTKAMDTISMIQDVPIISQFPELPTGCEATSLTMVLQYFGVEKSKIDIANDLPKSPLPSMENGRLVGTHPSEAFIGSPFDARSYGVFHEPIIDMVEGYVPQRAENLSGQEFEQILNTVDDGRPVMVWVSIGLLPIDERYGWVTEEDEGFIWPGNEHALVVVGYTQDQVITNDPYRGQEVYYDKQLFMQRWNDLGRQAVTLKTNSPMQWQKDAEEKIIMTIPSMVKETKQKAPRSTPYVSPNITKVENTTLLEVLSTQQSGGLAYREAIIRFQASKNLIVDGVLGPKTKKAILSSQEVEDQLPDSLQREEWCVVINKSRRILTVYHKGKIYKKYPVAVGKSSSPTPNYKFSIVSKVVDPAWGGMGGKYEPIKGGDPKNPLGPRWFGLSYETYKGYGIHGNSSPYSIGKSVSSGCIRMVNEDVKELFTYLPSKIPVWVGTEEVLLSWGVRQSVIE